MSNFRDIVAELANSVIEIPRERREMSGVRSAAQAETRYVERRAREEALLRSRADPVSRHEAKQQQEMK